MEVKAKAEAEQMAKKADAWGEYKEAALVDMMLQVNKTKKKLFIDCRNYWMFNFPIDPDARLFGG